MALGYDGKLYILAFDHRGSFQKKMFGIEGDPTPEETEHDHRRQAADLRGHGAGGRARRRRVRGRRARRRAVRRRRPAAARKEHGLSLAMPVEKSGQDEFDFQYGDDFGEHIEKFDPDFAKVLVRYNPDGDAEMNERQLEPAQAARRLAARRTTASSCSSCSCRPSRRSSSRSAATPTATTPSCGPELMRRAIEDIQNYGDRGRHLEDRGRRRARGRRDARRADAQGRGPRERRLRAARPRRERREGRPLAAAGRAGRGLRRLRDRPLDLVGRAQGLPRRRARARAPRPSRSPTTTCASSRSTTTRRPARASDAAVAAAALAARRASPRCGDVHARDWLAGRPGASARHASCRSSTATRSSCGWTPGARSASATSASTRRRPSSRTRPASACGPRGARSTSGSSRGRRGARSRFDVELARPLRPPARLRLRRADDLFVNAQLVRRGYAEHAQTSPPNVRHAERFAGLGRGRPRARGRGLWGACASWRLLRAHADAIRASPRSKRPSSRRSRRTASGASGCGASRAALAPAPHRARRTARHAALRAPGAHAIATAVVVTIAMFETLYYVMG